MDRSTHDPEELVARYVRSPRPELKDLIMVQYTGLVERVARKYAGVEPLQDLVQVGFIGLLNALGKFNPDAGVRFNTYATHLVTGEIKHYLRDRSQTIRQPAWLQELRHKVNRTAGVLHQTTGRQPTAGEIANQIGVSEQQVQEVLNTQDMLRVQSLDSARSTEDDSNSDLDRVEADSPAAQVDIEQRIVLEKAMGRLRELERQVLTLFHFETRSQSDIARELGISSNYVSHILRQSLAKLRKILEEDEAQDRLLRAPDMDFEVVDRDTGAYTEAFFRNRLDEELHRSSAGGGDVGLLVIEFSGLAEMRKYFGTNASNAFLTEAAEFLKSNVRRLDVVARVGEYGFGVILPYAGHNVGIVRERLTLKIMEWAPGRATGTGLGVLIGEAWSPSNGRSCTALVEACKQHMTPVAH